MTEKFHDLAHVSATYTAAINSATHSLGLDDYDALAVCGVLEAISSPLKFHRLQGTNLSQSMGAEGSKAYYAAILLGAVEEIKSPHSLVVNQMMDFVASSIAEAGEISDRVLSKKSTSQLSGEKLNSSLEPAFGSALEHLSNAEIIYRPSPGKWALSPKFEFASFLAPSAKQPEEKQTAKQELGSFGELRVSRECECPRCKRPKTLKRLPNNFKCADVICEFCGFLAQVKALTSCDVNILPKRVLGAAWKPQEERMKSSIYFPLFIVLRNPQGGEHAIYYLSPDLQPPELFKPRKPLSAKAKRAGWQGFMYDLESVHERVVRLI